MHFLSKLIRRERARILEQAGFSGTVSKEDFEGLDRLEKLAASDRSWRHWWVPACAFLVPLIVVTLLMETERRETQIDLDANVRAFRATLSHQRPVFERSPLKALEAIGLEGVDDIAAGDGDCSAQLRLNEKPGPGDAINLQLLEIPQGWRLYLEHFGDAIEVTMSHPGAQTKSVYEEVPTTVSVSGPAHMKITCGGSSDLRVLKAGAIARISLRVGPQTGLTLTPLEGHPLRFARQIAVDQVALVSEEVAFGDTRENRQLSSVLSGTLYLNSLNGKQVPLRPSEALTFGEFTGTIRDITLSADGLRLQLFATVKGMRTGDAPNQRSLMPTYLQWIGARDDLWLVWGGAVSVFTALLTVLRYLKVTG